MYNFWSIWLKNIVDTKSYVLSVTDVITYIAVFLFPKSSKFILFDVVILCITGVSKVSTFDIVDITILCIVLSAAVLKFSYWTRPGCRGFNSSKNNFLNSFSSAPPALIILRQLEIFCSSGGSTDIT